MRIRTHFRSVPHPSGWRDELASRLRKVQTLLESVNAGDSLLEATLEAAPDGRMVTLRLHMPGKRILAVSGRGADASAATEQAAQRLFRRAERHLDRLRHQDSYRRRARRDRLHALKAEVEALPPERRQEARGIIDESMIARLEAVARRELAYLRATRDLPRDYPTTSDVVDEAVASATAAWRPGTSADDAWIELLRALYAAIDREVEVGRRYGMALSLEAPVPAGPEDVPEAMVEEEIYEFYQPDEALTLADVLSDSEAIAEPDDEPLFGRLSEQALVADVLKALPITWRRAILLADYERLAAEDVGTILATSTSTAGRWIEQAGAFLDARLRDAGIGGAEPSGTTLAEWLTRRE